MMSFDQLDYLNQVLGATEQALEKPSKSDTVARLRGGEGLCTVCGQLGPVHRFVVVQKQTYPRCEEGCEYDNGNPSQLITWRDVRDGLSQTVSECQWKWLEQHHPELVAAAEEAEAAL